MADEIIEHYGKRVGYSDSELERFHVEGHRTRHVKRLAEVAPLYSFEVEVVTSKHCNSGYEKGDKLIMDVVY